MSKKSLVSNFNKTRFVMMQIYLASYIMLYWYMNEKEYGGERKNLNNVGKKYE